MYQIIKPPTSLPNSPAHPTVFLAGSIEMGAAVNWQDQIVTLLSDLLEKSDAEEPLIVLNPRRDEWDASWRQSIDEPQFCEQVEWELAAQEMADWILFYFDPHTKSPVTLLEFGLAAKSGKACVCCPTGFWRKGNVDIVCRRWQIPMVDDLPALAQWLHRQSSLL